MEEPHLKAVLQGEAGEHLVFACAREIVDQQADAHAARGGFAQLDEQSQTTLWSLSR